MYGPAAQSDDVLIFKADGTGRFEFINLILCSADFFVWEMSDSEHISIRGFKRLSLDETARNVIESSSDFEYIDIPYQIREEVTKSGKRIRVLRLDLGKGKSDHFGLVRNDLAGFEQPNFQLD